jgi:hypothetical protein
MPTQKAKFSQAHLQTHQAAPLKPRLYVRAASQGGWENVWNACSALVVAAVVKQGMRIPIKGASSKTQGEKVNDNKRYIVSEPVAPRGS